MHSPEKTSVRAPNRSERAELSILAGTTSAAEHSVEAEAALLSCCLIDSGATLRRCREAALTPKAFATPRFAIAWTAMVALQDAGHEVDAPMLAEHLLRSVEGLDLAELHALVDELMDCQSTTAHAAYFLEAVWDCWMHRQAAWACRKMREAQSEHPEWRQAAIAMEPMLSLLQGLQPLRGGDDSPAAKNLRGLERLRQQAAGKQDRSRWLHSGVRRFDEAAGRLDVRDEDFLVVIAALPSGGKSAWMRQYSSEALRAGKRVAYFALETTFAKWLDQLAGLRTRVNVRDLEGTLRDHRDRFFAEREGLGALLEKSLFLRDDVPTLDGIEMTSSALHRVSGGLDLIVVDYLQIVQVNKKEKTRNREEEVALISRRLKALAKKLDCTLLVGAQINREVEKESRRPRMSDLRESGAIGQDADRVIALHVPKVDMRDSEQSDNQSRVMVELLQLKSRNGPKAAVRSWFDRPYTAFSDVAADESEAGPDSSGRPGSSAPAKKPASYASLKGGVR